MAGQDWSITITPSGQFAAFNPNPQQAQNADLVAWNNRTGETHQPWPLGQDGQPIPEADITRGSAGCTYLSDPIDPWSSSSPAYLCQAPDKGKTTIEYTCKFHPEERGSIVVSA